MREYRMDISDRYDRTLSFYYLRAKLPLRMRITVALIIAFLSLTSCSKSYVIDKAVGVDGFPEPAYYQLIPLVDRISHKSEPVRNDSLSALSGIYIDSIIRNSTDFRVSGRMPINDRMLRFKSETELAALVNRLSLKRKISGVTVPPITDSILKSNKARYAAVIIITGFERTKENLENRFKDNDRGIFKRMDNYMNASVENRLMLYTVIVDSEKNSVLYFSGTPYLNASPLDKKALAAQYKKLFEGYLRRKQG